LIIAVEVPVNIKEIRATVARLLAPLMQIEATIRRPLVDLGLPEIPGPTEMLVKFVEALPEIPKVATEGKHKETIVEEGKVKQIFYG